MLQSPTLGSSARRVPRVATMPTRSFAQIRLSLARLLPALNARVQLRTARFSGHRVTLSGRAVIDNQGTITLGDRVRLVSTEAKLELATLPGGHLEIGDSVFINYGTSIAASEHVKIGNDCLI